MLKERGTTLVEVIVIILIIGIFSAVLISNFPKILREFALSRAAYKLAQDIRRAEDLSLSGVQLTGASEDSIVPKGYGVYINLSGNLAEQYLVYADRGENYNRKFDSNLIFCNQTERTDSDCILEMIYVNKYNPDLYIKRLENCSSNYTSINFDPPNPNVIIDSLSQNNFEIGIVLGLKSEDSAQRTVWVNTSGLIRVE